MGQILLMKPSDLHLLAFASSTFNPIESVIFTMAKKNKTADEEILQTNGAPVEFADGDFDDAGFEEEQIGFPPYWTPVAGRKLRIKVIALDARDPEFVRWTVQATHNVACQSGPSDEAEPRLVKAGEFFSMSLYAGLPLQRYVGEEVIVSCKEERDIGGGKSFWQWTLRCTSETHARVNARLEEQRKLMAEQASEAPLLLNDNLYAETQKAKQRVQDAMKAAKSGAI
jgi:hypothetical protein